MDKFEQEYFEDLRAITPKFEGKLNEIAKERLKMFAAAVTRQLITGGQNFDLIIGPGNSGLFMTHLTKLVYQALGLEAPEIINVPITRIFEEGKEMKLIFPETKLTEKDVKNVLFVDDEIMRAGTAKTCFELLLIDKPLEYRFKATIIAENHFFEWHYDLPQVSIRFFAYARLIQWINGIMGHLIPDDLLREIQKVYPEIETHNDALAMVLSGGIKRMRDGKPYYDFEAENELENGISGYGEQKNALASEIKTLIEKGIYGYKNEEIKFRF